MLFCDMTVNGEVLWTGVPCLAGVDINSFAYVGFKGSLIFVDTMGYTDPQYQGLADRYVLIYTPPGSQTTTQIPLQAVPAQQQNIVLDTQNCVISIYEKELNTDLLLATYVTITAPASGLVSSIFTATAAPVMSTYTWSISNGVILSGQGTAVITYQATSVAPVVLTLVCDLPQGGQTNATATTIIYDLSSFAISAPEYVWAGQFDIPVSVPFSGSGFQWSVAGAVRLIGSETNGSTIVDAGRASFGASISAVVASLVVSTWNFKIVPYTSSISFVTASLPAGGYQDFELDLGWQYEINSMSSSYPCLLRVYETAAARTADAGRSLVIDPNAPPTNPSVIVFEGATAIGTLAFNLTHSAIGTNGDGPPRLKTAYCRLYNVGVGTAIITLNLTRTELQTSATF